MIRPMPPMQKKLRGSSSPLPREAVPTLIVLRLVRPITAPGEGSLARAPQNHTVG
jgi:hypothetical protein